MSNKLLPTILKNGIKSVNDYLQSLLPKETLKESYNDFVVNILSADGLAPLGARPSAGMMMTKFRYCLSMGQTLNGDLWYLTKVIVLCANLPVDSIIKTWTLRSTMIYSISGV